MKYRNKMKKNGKNQLEVYMRILIFNWSKIKSQNILKGQTFIFKKCASTRHHVRPSCCLNDIVVTLYSRFKMVLRFFFYQALFYLFIYLFLGVVSKNIVVFIIDAIVSSELYNSLLFFPLLSFLGQCRLVLLDVVFPFSRSFL